MRGYTRIINFTTREILWFSSKPKIRKYKIEHPKDDLVIDVYDIHFKTEMVKLLNQATREGELLTHGADSEDFSRGTTDAK